ncbi:MAG: hypothetical protein AAGA35_00970 [Patescibacteria group bacterium]
MSFFNEENVPGFIPKVMDGKITEWTDGMDFLAIDLNHVKWRGNVLPLLRDHTPKLLVDPVTHKAFFSDAKSKTNFQKIGYPDIEPELLYSEKRHRSEFIELSVNEQLTAGANAIIAPYLYTPDTDDTKFAVNLTLLSETLVYLEQNEIDLPVFAKICTHSQILTRQLVINNIVSRYCDDYSDRLEGVILSITDFDARKNDLPHLLGLANLVHQLQARTKVLLSPMGGYGEVLLALGAAAFSSGIHESEGITVKQLQEGSGGSEHIHQRIYIPEILNYINYEEAAKIGYVGTSTGCNIDFNDSEPSAETKKRHYLNNRVATIATLRGKSREEKINLMIGSISSAQRLLTRYIRDHELLVRNDFHARWIQVLEQARTWSDPETDNEELEALLAEIDKSDD